MKSRGIIILIILLAVVIISMIILDYLSNRPGKRTGNKYELDIESYKTIDTSFIDYKEIRNYTVTTDSLRAIAISGQEIYVAADRFIKVFDLKGITLLQVNLTDSPMCLDITGDKKILVGFKNRIGLYEANGEQIWLTDTFNSSALYTAIALKKDRIFVADAGNRVVHQFDNSGKYLDHFAGKASSEDLHGFIIPSLNFDLKINGDGELWVTNPGKHALENYTDEGELRGYWQNLSSGLDGFTGCCNPSHFTFLKDGSFVTSEKGFVRIKIHKSSGEFQSVVAAPEKFLENGKAPDVAADVEGNIYALDYDKKIIRVFTPK
jgi:hypothetical protein